LNNTRGSTPTPSISPSPAQAGEGVLVLKTTSSFKGTVPGFPQPKKPYFSRLFGLIFLIWHDFVQFSSPKKVYLNSFLF